MERTNHEDADASSPPLDEVFRILGNDVRIRTLQALWEVETPVSFSELASAVDATDPGNFNYHLGKLTPQFIRRTDEGYELSQPGQRVVSAISSRLFTGLLEVAPTEVDAPCPYCGARIVITYAEEQLLVQCTECSGFTIPINLSAATESGESAHGSRRRVTTSTMSDEPADHDFLRSSAEFGSYHALHDWSRDGSIVTTIVTAIRDISGDELIDRVSDHIDPDALETLFQPGSATQCAEGHVTFPLDRYEVTVKATGQIVIEEH